LAMKKLELYIPAKLYDDLEKAEKKSGVKKEDLISRALIKVIEEFSE